ncbi:MAG: flagellar hook-basal body protein [bacterium]|nr:flagellar hook-basal body protein [bacterium]
MTYGLWLSAGGLQVNQYRQDIVTNNLANVETPGFKRDLAVIHERQVEAQSSADGLGWGHRLLDRLSGGNWVRPTYTDFGQGGLARTESGLDAAIEGEGFFSVLESGEPRFTRDGRFTLNPAGEVVMVAGDGQARVLDDSGSPITLDPAGGKITISQDGTISQDETQVAKLGIVEFADRQTLRKVGGNLFESTGAQPTAAQNSKVHGGYVESSAQNPITGLVEMIEATRAHDLNARMIMLQDQTVGQAVNTVGRVS